MKLGAKAITKPKIKIQVAVAIMAIKVEFFIIVLAF
jgi:hypothetical protein